MRRADMLLLLTAGARRIALPMEQVRQVVAARSLTPVPLARPEVAGVLAGGGQAIPVYRLEQIDVRGLRALPAATLPAAHDHRPEIVILEEDGALAGFLVQKAEATRQIPGESVPTLAARTLLTAVGLRHAGAADGRAAPAAQGEGSES